MSKLIRGLTEKQFIRKCTLWTEKALSKPEFKHIPWLEYASIDAYGYLNKLISVITFIQNYANNSHFRILDMGCGLGRVALSLGSLGHSVLGIDICSKSLSFAKNRAFAYDYDITFLHENMRTYLKRTSDSFDIILALDLLEHVDSPDLIVNLATSHLRKDGVIIVSVPNGYSPSEFFWNSLNKCRKLLHISMPKGHEHKQHFTYKTLRHLIESCGLEFRFVYVEGGVLSILCPFPIVYYPIWKLDKHLAKICPKQLAAPWIAAGVVK